MLKEFLNKRTIIFISILLVIVGVYIFYVHLSNKTDGEIKYKDYTILKGHSGSIEKYDPSHTVEGYSGSNDKAYYINGKITSDVDKGFTIITFNLYDENNKLLGTAVAGINKMKKDLKYDFKALSLIKGEDIEKIDHYKIKSIELGN